jgi:cytidine deaminase
MALLERKKRDDLLEAARRAADGAHCPYSNFRVGAAVLSGGNIFTGANVENASFGLTVCAERVAVFSAVVSGARALDAIAVTCPDAPEKATLSTRVPCGACRQVLAEFADQDLIVVIDKVGEFHLKELFPTPFKL